METETRPASTAAAIDLLRKVPFMQSLGEAELASIAPHLFSRRYRSGEYIIEEGTVGEEFFIIRSGSTKIAKTTAEGTEEIASVQRAGQFFGEMALIEDLPRSASVIALEDTETMVLARTEFKKLLASYPELSLGLVRELSRRLRELDHSFIRDLQERKRRLRHAFNQLRHAQEKLREQERIKNELAISKRIQESLLPQAHPVVENFEIYAVCRPAYEVGGDFFVYTDYGPGTIGLAIGDVSGKSVPAALLMAVATSTISSLAFIRSSPSEILSTANTSLYEKMAGSRSFVALCFGCLDGPQRRFRVANAGNVQPILCRADRSFCGFVEVTGLPLGVVNLSGEGYEYAEMELELCPGDLLVLSTDGLAEAMNEDNELYGFDRLLESVASCIGLSASAVIDRVVADVEAFTGAAPPHDDLTAIALVTR